MEAERTLGKAQSPLDVYKWLVGPALRALYIQDPATGGGRPLGRGLLRISPVMLRQFRVKPKPDGVFCEGHKDVYNLTFGARIGCAYTQETRETAPFGRFTWNGVEQHFNWTEGDGGIRLTAVKTSVV